MNCSQCGKGFDPADPHQPAASISGSIMGDEQTESYFFCSLCGIYTVEVYHDRFLGEDEISVYGPISRQVGDEKVALIRECPEPWDKKCRCKAHRTYFEGRLD